MYGVSLNELIEKLNTPGAIQTEAQFEDVLFAINQRLSVGDPISSMRENLEVLRQGLDHPNLKLRTFSLDHLARCSSSDSGRSFLKDTGLLITIVNTIGDDNISLASKAATISSKAGTLVLEDAECANILKQFMPLDSSIVDISSIGLRVLDMVVDIALGSHEQFQYCWDQGWLGPVFTVVRSTEPGVAPDPMHLLNIMQLLEKLVGKEPGIVQRLSSNQGEAGRVVKWIIEAARSWNTQAGAGSADPAVATLAGPEVLRLLQLLLCPLPDTARRAAEDIAIIRQHNIEPIVLEILQSEERDEIKQEAALGVIGAIGCSLAGMEWLLQSPSLLQELRDAFMSSLPLLRIGSIYWLSFMLQYCQDEDMTEELFIHHLSTGQDVGTSPSALLRLVNNLKNHSQKELRGQTLRALEALADLKWGRRELMLCPGLVSWLLKRGTEMEKTGMEWKFSIIQRLVKHPEECAGLIGDEEYIKLNVYVREGIFFKESNVTVAISDRAA